MLRRIYREKARDEERKIRKIKKTHDKKEI